MRIPLLTIVCLLTFLTAWLEPLKWVLPIDYTVVVNYSEFCPDNKWMLTIQNDSLSLLKAAVGKLFLRQSGEARYR